MTSPANNSNTALAIGGASGIGHTVAERNDADRVFTDLAKHHGGLAEPQEGVKASARSMV